jgi:Rps23 Pro-64 3,4-dihydroxylase Tpa1-like proline 4-hydroxylase
MTYQMREIKPGSFIYEIPNALPSDVCQEIIRRFEERTDQQQQGRIGQQQSAHHDIKRSTDIHVSTNKGWEDIDEHLFQSLKQALAVFSAEFPFFAANRFRDLGYNVQRTRPGEYYHWHVDSGPGENFVDRQLVALWYLNDVPGPGGETEFDLQRVKIRPNEGSLVLFPPFWTHVHRNVTLELGVKYIATTGVCYA